MSSRRKGATDLHKYEIIIYWSNEDRALEILRTELQRALALLGCPTVGDLSAAHVRRRV